MRVQPLLITFLVSLFLFSNYKCGGGEDSHCPQNVINPDFNAEIKLIDPKLNTPFEFNFVLSEKDTTTNCKAEIIEKIYRVTYTAFITEYKENQGSNWILYPILRGGVLRDTIVLPISPPITCEGLQSELSYRITLTNPGIYRLSAIVDFENDVEERNENKRLFNKVCQ